MLATAGWRSFFNKLLVACTSSSWHRSSCGRTDGAPTLAKCQNYLGIGIDTALPAPRSAIQSVLPAGSTPVGVSSPPLSTVTLALSPCSRDFAAAILCEDELIVRRAHAVWPFYRLVDPDIDWYSRFTRSIDWDAIKLVEDHVVHIEHAIEECNPIDAPECRML